MRPTANQSIDSRAVDARFQIDVSPYRGVGGVGGAVNYSALEGRKDRGDLLDPVSIADLLRNGFVYPPHSIYSNVKVATTGFDPNQDLYHHPRFQLPFRYEAAPVRPASGSRDDETLSATYHRLLCDAVRRCTQGMHSPWLLQSGGKDSTSMAIAAAEANPQVACLTYLGGSEENEVGSARRVASKLGLRHEALVCDPGRAYDRYLAMVPQMPLLTADFALLSYADLATEINHHGGDGIIDALGSDPYFGTPLTAKKRMLLMLARGVSLPSGVYGLNPVRRNFPLCYALGTLQMNSAERFYPGSRFTDAETDDLFGGPMAAASLHRLKTFRAADAADNSWSARRRVASAIIEPAIYAKGMYCAEALGLRLVYPFCDERLVEWVFHEVPDDRLVGAGGLNKVLVRRHIAEHFRELPYVEAKGSFRFDLCGLAQQRFDQVHAFAEQTRAVLPGAQRWLETHRGRFDNKYFASKFYLLAVVLPWLHWHMSLAPPKAVEGMPS